MIVDPLDPAALARASRDPLRPPTVLTRTDSTNSVVADAARAGQQEGLVVVATEQTAGRGRLGRHWVAPGDVGLTFSVLLRPPRSGDQLGFLPLVAGLAVAEAVRACTGVVAWLKWPNDVMVGSGKLAGILAELVAGAVVIGVGLNVHDDPGLPPGAASLAGAGAIGVARTPVLGAVLASLAARYAEWVRAPERAREPYLRHCRTINAAVVVTLPGGELVRGQAVDVDHIGRLVVDTGNSHRALASGDVVHVRSAGG